MKNIFLIFVCILVCGVSNSSGLFAGQLEIQIYPLSKLPTELEYPTLYASLYGHTTLHDIKKQAITLKCLSKEQYNLFHCDSQKLVPIIAYLAQEQQVPRRTIAHLIGATAYVTENIKLVHAIKSHDLAMVQELLTSKRADADFSWPAVYFKGVFDSLETGGRINTPLSCAVFFTFLDPLSAIKSAIFDTVLKVITSSIDDSRSHVGQHIVGEIINPICAMTTFALSLEKETIDKDPSIEVFDTEKNISSSDEVALIKTHVKSLLGKILSRRPDLNVPDCEGNFPLDYCKENLNNDSKDIEDIIKKHDLLNQKIANHNKELLHLYKKVSNEELSVEDILPTINKNSAMRYKDPLGNTLLHALCYNTKKYTQAKDTIARHFLDNNIDPNMPNCTGTTALFAAMQHSPLLIELLLKRGADPLHTDLAGRGIAHYASLEALQLLHKNIEDKIYKKIIDIQDFRKKAPLHYWLRCDAACYRERVSWVIQIGANSNVQSIYGSTPLHLAVRESEYATVKKLLHYKADPNIQNNDGKTPLHDAVDRNAFLSKRTCRKLVKLLVQYKADIGIKNKQGKSPFEVELSAGLR